MANCLEITLWYPEDKFNALSTALEPAGSSVEEELGRVLTELYERLVPSEPVSYTHLHGDRGNCLGRGRRPDMRRHACRLYPNA